MNKWIILAPFLAWYIWIRVRRYVGRQKFRTRKLLFTVVVFGAVTAALAVPCALRPTLALGWAGGLVLGAALGLLALHLTRFEHGPEGQFYTPNAHIGLLLALLFLARMAYRISVLNGGQSLMASRPPPAVGNSALTFLVVELLAGYYLAYNLGVIRRFRALALAAPPA